MRRFDAAVVALLTVAVPEVESHDDAVDVILHLWGLYCRRHLALL